MTTVVPLNRDAENEREPTLEAGTGSHDESAAARQAEHDQRARLGMRPVASDGNHHGPWLWPIQYRTRGNNGKVEYNILQFSPEHFRCWGYSLFLLILFIGFILTEYFSYAPGKYESRECISRDAPGCKLSLDNPFNDSFIAWDYDKQADVYLTEDVAFGPLEAAYGYNNPCVYLDFPPANIILPVVWVFAVMSFCAGFFFSMVRHRVALNVSSVHTILSQPKRASELILILLVSLDTRHELSGRKPFRFCAHAASGKFSPTAAFRCVLQFRQSKYPARVANW